LRRGSGDGRQAARAAAHRKTATFIIFETPEEGIGFPLGLNGIGEGYDRLP
jgi:invasion protein IalB